MLILYFKNSTFGIIASWSGRLTILLAVRIRNVADKFFSHLTMYVAVGNVWVENVPHRRTGRTPKEAGLRCCRELRRRKPGSNAHRTTRDDADDRRQSTSRGRNRVIYVTTLPGGTCRWQIEADGIDERPIERELSARFGASLWLRLPFDALLLNNLGQVLFSGIS